MISLFRSTLLGVGLLAGIAATAHAQAVSALPPTNAATVSAATTPPVSSAKIYPSPGNGTAWQGQHYQTSDADRDPARHPYSTPKFGPAPN
jgi:hypothetical protein